jgi:hypothetical protein
MIGRCLLAIFGFVLVASAPARAQSDIQKCPDAKVYENHNQVDYGPLKVSAVSGSARFETGNKSDKESPVAAGACITVFTDDGHRWVSTVNADSSGNFRFDSLAPGRYRLVARARGLCTANVRIEVAPRGKRSKSQGLMIHFRAPGVDTCSFVDYGRK